MSLAGHLSQPWRVKGRGWQHGGGTHELQPSRTSPLENSAKDGGPCMWCTHTKHLNAAERPWRGRCKSR